MALTVYQVRTVEHRVRNTRLVKSFIAASIIFVSVNDDDGMNSVLLFYFLVDVGIMSIIFNRFGIMKTL